MSEKNPATTAQIKEADYFRLWQFSDTHLHTDPDECLYGIPCEKSLRQVLSHALAAAKKAELCLFTGDLVQDGSECAYQRLLGYLDNLFIPVYCLAGNHDDKSMMKSTLTSGKVSCKNYIVHKQWLIVLLDTTITGSNAGHLSQAECHRVELLCKRYPDLYVLLAMHHPPLSTTMHWLDNGVTLDNPDRVQCLVKQHKQIRGVVWGHAHQASLIKKNNVLWAGCPSTMAQFRADVIEFTLDDKLPGFRYLDLWSDGEIKSDVIRVAERHT